MNSASRTMRWIAALALVVALSSMAAQAQGTMPLHPPDGDAEFERFTKPLDNDAQRAVRVLTLSNLVSRNCRGASLDRGMLAKSAAASTIAKATPDDIELALIVVRPDFSYVDDGALARLCLRIDDLLGPHGVLAPSLVARGTGRPNRAPNPANPYLVVEMLPKRRAP